MQNLTNRENELLSSSRKQQKAHEKLDTYETIKKLFLNCKELLFHDLKKKLLFL